MTEPKDFDLGEAYAVETPQDNVELYARWASTYETFVERNGYQHPFMVAAELLALGGRDHQPRGIICYRDKQRVLCRARFRRALQQRRQKWPDQRTNGGLLIGL